MTERLVVQCVQFELLGESSKHVSSSTKTLVLSLWDIKYDNKAGITIAKFGLSWSVVNVLHRVRVWPEDQRNHLIPRGWGGRGQRGGGHERIGRSLLIPRTPCVVHTPHCRYETVERRLAPGRKKERRRKGRRRGDPCYWLQ